MTPQADQNDVSTALSLLRDSLSEEEQRIRMEGSQAMQSGEYDTATSVIDFAKRLLAFQGRVADLEKEWLELEDLRDKASPAVQQIVSKRFFGRRKSGDITSHFDFCRPILELLCELGDKAKTKQVLDALEGRMKATLKPKDYEKHKSEPHQIRWRNTAQWARNYMVNNDGRMKKGSPNGVWEISEKGKIWLKQQ